MGFLIFLTTEILALITFVFEVAIKKCKMLFVFAGELQMVVMFGQVYLCPS